VAAPFPGSDSHPHVEAPPIGRLEMLLAVAGVVAIPATALLLPRGPACFGCAFLVVALVIARSDARSYTIPDWASAALALLGLLDAASSATAAGAPLLPALGAAGASGAAAFALFWAIAAAHRWLRGHDGLGFGDVKLAGACALWLSPGEQAATLEVAALAGLALLFATMRRGAAGEADRRAVPFGALLAPTAWIVHMAGAVIDLGWLS
jgi:prepilin signal peptidase PulO-like enzyme (type II secretory pathway)